MSSIVSHSTDSQLNLFPHIIGSDLRDGDVKSGFHLAHYALYDLSLSFERAVIMETKCYLQSADHHFPRALLQVPSSGTLQIRHPV